MYHEVEFIFSIGRLGDFNRRILRYKNKTFQNKNNFFRQKFIAKIQLSNMEKKKISLNLGGLKLGGSTSSQTHDDPGTSGFGSFGKKEPEKLVKEKDNVELVAESEENLYKVMGFSGFGDSKKAKQFDMGKILEEARSKAIERNAEKNLELESSAASIFEQSSSRKSTEKNKEKKLEKTSATPPIKPQNDEDNSSDDDFIGPPIPETLKKSEQQPSSSKSAEQNDSNESTGNFTEKTNMEFF